MEPPGHPGKPPHPEKLKKANNRFATQAIFRMEKVAEREGFEPSIQFPV